MPIPLRFRAIDDVNSWWDNDFLPALRLKWPGVDAHCLTIDEATSILTTSGDLARLASDVFLLDLANMTGALSLTGGGDVATTLYQKFPTAIYIIVSEFIDKHGQVKDTQPDLRLPVENLPFVFARLSRTTPQEDPSKQPGAEDEDDPVRPEDYLPEELDAAFRQAGLPSISPFACDCVHLLPFPGESHESARSSAWYGLTESVVKYFTNVGSAPQRPDKPDFCTLAFAVRGGRPRLVQVEETHVLGYMLCSGAATVKWLVPSILPGWTSVCASLSNGPKDWPDGPKGWNKGLSGGKYVTEKFSITRYNNFKNQYLKNFRDFDGLLGFRPRQAIDPCFNVTKSKRIGNSFHFNRCPAIQIHLPFDPKQPDADHKTGTGEKKDMLGQPAGVNGSAADLKEWPLWLFCCYLSEHGRIR